ncbi:MAG TPA: hypothetical protein VNT58_02560 [Gaiellaceae bacterium]|nr:hypothetical protein [Gaiellaceae bacterium]
MQRGRPRCTLLEQALRLVVRHPADVDPGDRDPVGEPRRRAGEREPDERREHGEERHEDEQ